MADDAVLERIRVFICDDHVIVREGLKRLIETAGDMEVAGEAGDAAETLARLPESGAQVVLMDIRLPDSDGVQATAAIRQAYPHIRVLALSTFMDDDLIFGAIHAGASGYLAKDVEPERLFDALRAVASNKPIMSGEVVNRVIQRILSSDAPSASSTNVIDQLTPQERVILGLLAEGLSNQAMADRLVVSVKTVKSHLSNIFGKLGVHTRSQAVVRYMKAQQASEREA